MDMGIPCGGKMAVIVESQLSAPVMLIRGMGRVAASGGTSIPPVW